MSSTNTGHAIIKGVLEGHPPGKLYGITEKRFKLEKKVYKILQFIYLKKKTLLGVHVTFKDSFVLSYFP